MKLKRRKRKVEVINANNGSPCGSCIRLGENKNEGMCVDCEKPYFYALAVEEASPYCKAIDYTEVFSLNRLEAVHAYVDGDAI